MLTGTDGYFGFICTEGVGDGGFVVGGGRQENIFLAFSQTVPHPLSRFDTHSEHLKQLETARSAKRSIPTILQEIGDCKHSMYSDLRE